MRVLLAGGWALAGSAKIVSPAIEPWTVRLDVLGVSATVAEAAYYPVSAAQIVLAIALVALPTRAGPLMVSLYGAGALGVLAILTAGAGAHCGCLGNIAVLPRWGEFAYAGALFGLSFAVLWSFSGSPEAKLRVAAECERALGR